VLTPAQVAELLSARERVNVSGAHPEIVAREGQWGEE
jgi:hypothetical protein